MDSQDLTKLRLKRGQLKAQITRANTYLKSLNLDNIQENEIAQLNSRLERLQTVLNQFDELQSEIELNLSLANESLEIEDLERSNFEDAYFNLIGKINQTIDKFTKEQQKSEDLVSTSATQLQVKLPDIKLPTFNGNFDNWLEFRDAFSDLVHNNDSFTGIQKFYHLRSFLEGEPLDLIASIKISNDNYSVAWSLLVERYENLQLIVHQYVKELFEFPTLIKESCTDLLHLYDTFTKNIRSLKYLGQPTDSWDTLLIYLITTKFDSSTRRAWEAYPLDCNTLPTWIEMSRFLKTRCDFLKKLDIAKPNKKPDNVTIKSLTNSKPSVFKTRALAASTGFVSCYYCKQRHTIYQCQTFLALDVQDRWNFVDKTKLCHNCLDPSHSIDQCQRSQCRICSKKHNTLLHSRAIQNVENTPPRRHGRMDGLGTTAHSAVVETDIADNLEKSDDSGANFETMTNLVGGLKNSTYQSKRCLLATAVVKVYDTSGNVHYVRALIDPGSESNFISEKLLTILGYEGEQVSYSIIGVGESTGPCSKYQTNLTVYSRVCDYNFTMPYLLLKKITGQMPNASFDKSMLNLPENAQLADPDFNISRNIDLLIGAGYYFDFLIMEQLKIPGIPILQNSKFGWLIGGLSLPVYNNHTNSLLAINHCIEDSLTRFWQLEECGDARRILTKDEEFCEQHFQTTFKRQSSGRFVVSIPFKGDISKIGDSKEVALNRFLSLEKRFSKNQKLKEEYASFMTEYKELGHMTLLPELSSKNSELCYYLPHHAIRKESLTTPIRVVFDASSKSSSGLSLNEVQYVGPTIQHDLLSILLRFRCHNYVLNADISKMYRQVMINPDDRRFQRIFWRQNPEEPLQCYELNTVTYGTASAPFLAVRSLHQLGYESQGSCPRISQIILEDFYMDDLLTGCDTIPELIDLQRELSSVLAGGCFELRKWLSNRTEVLDQFKVNKDLHSNILKLGPGEQNKTLGILWNATEDNIQYSIRRFPYQSDITKRAILSVISQIFDPLGLLGPIVVNAKIMLQSLWQDRLSWDEKISDETSEKWLKFCKDIQHLNSVKIPRHVLSVTRLVIELHGFSDSSERAYGACIYLVCQVNSTTYVSQLLCAKSRVAPIKRVTLPRLELCAAVLLSKLVDKVRMSLNLKISRYFYWSDSTIVLCWIKACPSRWKTFVANRVSTIQGLTNVDDWYHVASEDNPADYLSRGTTADILKELSLWWQGPIWLTQARNTWKLNKVKETINIPEERVRSHVAFAQRSDFPFDRFSSIIKLKRTTAFCYRFINNLKGNTSRINGPLTTSELDTALLQILKITQMQSFPKEYDDLQNNRPLQSSSSLLCLNPFLDPTGLIRVGGRIQLSESPYQKKHPIILPKKHHVTILLMRYEHQRLMHCGPQQLLYSIRENYWPVCGRAIARKVTKACVICFKAKPMSLNYLMGNLPKVRVTQYIPFINTGIDYAGPVLLKDRKTRNAKLLKGYICLFVCMSVKAVHLELVTELTSQAFLAVLRRFISRRGKPSVIYSDNGTTFVGANNELVDFLKKNSELISTNLSNEGINWRFIPPRSPNFGGLWESNIKQVKYHLKRILGNSNLTYEDFSTVLTQIEAILNSRPLCPLSSDPTDYTPLTPAHFLIGKSLTAIPEACFVDIPDNRLRKFEHLQKLIQHFWQRWHLEYISELQSRLKWKRQSSALLKIGNLVIVKDDNLPTLNWKIGRVVKIFPGTDNITRVVNVRCSDGSVLKRAVSKLCLLPVYDSHHVDD